MATNTFDQPETDTSLTVTTAAIPDTVENVPQDGADLSSQNAEMGAEADIEIDSLLPLLKHPPNLRLLLDERSKTYHIHGQISKSDGDDLAAFARQVCTLNVSDVVEETNKLSLGIFARLGALPAPLFPELDFLGLHGTPILDFVGVFLTPSLTSIQFWDIDEASEVSFLSALATVRDMVPTLQSLFVRNSRVSRAIYEQLLLFEGLVDLEFDTATPAIDHILTEDIGKMARLESLAIHDIDGQASCTQTRPESRENQLFIHLRSLSLTGTVIFMEKIIKQIASPAMESIFLMCLSRSDSADPNRLLSMLSYIAKTWSQTLSSFTLRTDRPSRWPTFYISEVTFKELLLCPELRTLEFSSVFAIKYLDATLQRFVANSTSKLACLSLPAGSRTEAVSLHTIVLIAAACPHLKSFSCRLAVGIVNLELPKNPNSHQLETMGLDIGPTLSLSSARRIARCIDHLFPNLKKLKFAGWNSAIDEHDMWKEVYENLRFAQESRADERKRVGNKNHTELIELARYAVLS